MANCEMNVGYSAAGAAKHYQGARRGDAAQAQESSAIDHRRGPCLDGPKRMLNERRGGSIGALWATPILPLPPPLEASGQRNPISPRIGVKSPNPGVARNGV